MRSNIVNICPPELYDQRIGNERLMERINIDMFGPSIIKRPQERLFLNGLIRMTRPEKIVEIGVHEGGTSAIILNAIEDMPDSKLHSIDLGTTLYNDSSKQIASVIKMHYKGSLDKWSLNVGKDPVDVIETIGGNIDFCFIDTAHVHPVECLNFLTVLPFMVEGATVVLHDISQFLYVRELYGATILFDCVVADKIIPKCDDAVRANIAAFQINSDTRKYIENIFYSLMMQWKIKMTEEIISKFSVFFTKYYSPKHVSLFEQAIKAQAEISKLYDKSKKKVSVVNRFEPTINENRKIVGSNGVDPVEFLRLCISMRAIPDIEVIKSKLTCLLSSDSEEEWSKATKILDDTLPEILSLMGDANLYPNLTKISSLLWSMVSYIATGDIFSKREGVRFSPARKADEHVVVYLLMEFSKAIFERPSAQIDFLFHLTSSSEMRQKSLIAAAWIALEDNRVLTASYLAKKAFEYKSYGITLSVVSTEIDKAAKERNLAAQMDTIDYDLIDYFCTSPFELFSVSGFDFKKNRAEYEICDCPDWNPVAVDSNQPWNSIQFQKVRESMHDGSFRYCNKAMCPKIVAKRLPKKSQIKDPWLNKVIDSKLVVLDEGPKDVKLAYDYHCNLKCPSCRPDFLHLTPEKTKQLDEYFKEIVLPLTYQARSMRLSAYGEAIVSPHSRKVFQLLSPETHPFLEIELRSNAIQLNKEHWELLGEGGKCIDFVRISIDGSNKETFEKLRYPGKWEKLLESVEFLRELLKNKEISRVSVTFVTQKDNYKQMSEIMRLCIEWGFELVIQRIRNFSMPHDKFREANIFDELHPMHNDFLEETNKAKNALKEMIASKKPIPSISFLDF